MASFYDTDLATFVKAAEKVGSAAESIAASIAKAAEAYAKSVEQRPQDSTTIFNGQ